MPLRSIADARVIVGPQVITRHNNYRAIPIQGGSISFTTKPRELLNKILEEEGLKQDRDGNVRTAYSLRQTYICFRLMEGAGAFRVPKGRSESSKKG